MSTAVKVLTVLVVLLGGALFLAVTAGGFICWGAHTEAKHWKQRCEEENRLFQEALQQRDRAVEQHDAFFREWEAKGQALKQVINRLESQVQQREKEMAALCAENAALQQRLEALARELDALKAANPSAVGADKPPGSS